MSEKRIALELRGVTKTFGEVVANKNVDLTLHHGEILAILGENGSGKTTLMNMIAGIYYPDEGHIYVDGEEANIRSPKDAFAYGVGMIHQHFKLVDVFSAADNIILGINDGTKYNKKEIAKKVSAIADKYGMPRKTYIIDRDEIKRIADVVHQIKNEDLDVVHASDR